MSITISRRQFIGKMAVAAAGLSFNGSSLMAGDNKREFSFAMIADCQYMNAPTRGSRHYKLSLGKLRNCVEELNKHHLEFVVHLGDFIDTGWKSLDQLVPVYNELRAPKYQVLGNHDFAVSDDKKLLVPQKMGMDKRYYHFAVAGWRFITLDGNDLSFLAWPKNHKRYAETAEYYKKHKLRSAKWNGAVSAEQLTWLENILKKANKSGEKVAIFCHFPAARDRGHELWNSKELVAILEKYPCVKAYFNGHNHHGGYCKQKGIHYLTVPGMVETANTTAYAIVKVTPEALIVNGIGRCKDFILNLR